TWNMAEDRLWLIDDLVAEDIVAQDVQRVGPYARQTIQFELDEQGRTGNPGGGGTALPDHPEYPAVGLVLQPHHAFGHLAVAQRVVYPTHAIPAAGQRPLPGNVDQFQGGR